MPTLVLVLLTLVSLSAATLPARIQSITRGTGVGKHAQWGIRIVDASNGKLVFESNGERLQVPASNTKLFTSALALSRLGPDYRFSTRVHSTAPPDSSGTVAGDLILSGAGDPTLAHQPDPGAPGSGPPDSLAAFRDLAGQVAARGVRAISGDIVGEDTAYVWEPYPAGWEHDDLVWDYGAPVSALAVHDNAIAVTLSPGAQSGEPARLALFPDLPYYEIENRATTVAKGPASVQVERMPDSRRLVLWGVVSQERGEDVERLAIDDPALYAAQALHQELARRGISISGRPRAQHRYPWEAPELGDGAEPALKSSNSPGVELARLTSAPLLEILRTLNKFSINLYAEMVLREVGRMRRGTGSLEAGLAEMRTFLAEAGISRDEWHFEDGSGLSRKDTVTPSAVTRLLCHMYSSLNREAWLSLLPVGGTDGTLAARFSGSRRANRVLAKTGTMSSISALSGYVLRRRGGALAFSIMANHYNAPTFEVQGLIDRIVLLLID